MKILFSFVIVFILMQIFQTEQKNYAIEKEKEITTPVNISILLKKACYDCHSSETIWPWYSKIAPFSWVISEHVNSGRKALNFSLWEEYTQKEKDKQLKNIYRTVYGSMPLQSYLWIHKNAILTKKEKRKIRDWTGVRSRKKQINSQN